MTRELLTEPLKTLCDAADKKRPKYRNRRTVVDGISFASAKEARRYGELKLLERAGEIENLTLQPRFRLEVNGKHVTTYVADFLYGLKGDASSLIVEDAKGFKTDAYKIKAKLFEAVMGFPVREV